MLQRILSSGRKLMSWRPSMRSNSSRAVYDEVGFDMDKHAAWLKNTKERVAKYIIFICCIHSVPCWVLWHIPEYNKVERKRIWQK